MPFICFVKRENAKKAEEILKKDDICSRQSIGVRDASSLNIKEEGSFFIIDGTEEGINRCKELIKDFIEKIDESKLKEAENKVKEEQDKATEGFGGIFG